MATKTLETIEELVEQVVDHPWDDSRWTIAEMNRPDYVDPVAGKEWDSEWDQLVSEIGYGYKQTDETDEQWEADERRRYELLDRRPARHRVSEYTLRRSGDSRWGKNSTIRLGRDLGAKVAETWKTRRSPYGYDRFVGAIKLATILKRLGKTDISAKVDRARKEIEAQREKNRRNYAREKVERLASQLRSVIEDHPEIDWPQDLESLTNLPREE